MIYATELLNFLCKAQKLSPSGVSLHQMDEGYKINLYLDWRDNNDFYNQSVLIDNEGKSTWNDGDCDFCTMDGILDGMIEKQKQKAIKSQKRKELIETLTPEQRELLGV